MQIRQLKGCIKLLDKLKTKHKNFVDKCKQINPLNKNNGAQGKMKSKKAKQYQYKAWKLIPSKDNEPKEKQSEVI